MWSFFLPNQNPAVGLKAAAFRCASLFGEMGTLLLLVYMLGKNDFLLRGSNLPQLQTLFEHNAMYISVPSNQLQKYCNYILIKN